MTMHTGWWTSLAPSSFQITIQLRGDTHKSVSEFFVERATSAASLPNPFLFLHVFVFHTLRCERNSLMSCKHQWEMQSEGTLPAWMELWQSDPWSAKRISPLHVYHMSTSKFHPKSNTVQFCSYSLICLQVENIRMAWPLSMKLDFWGHICALFHSEAAFLEVWGQAFQCISWFKLNSVTRGRETPHLGDLVIPSCTGLEPTQPPGEQRYTTSSLIWQQWGKTVNLWAAPQVIIVNLTFSIQESISRHTGRNWEHRSRHSPRREPVPLSLSYHREAIPFQL